MSSELRNVRVLSNLSDSQLEQLLPYGEFVEFDAGQQIIQQGQKADGIYFLIHGKAASYVSDKDGAQTPLMTSEDGAHFGEVALFRQGVRTASVRASSKCRLFRINLQSFESLLKSADLALPLVLALAKSMAVRMGTVTDRLADARSLRNAWH